MAACVVAGVGDEAVVAYLPLVRVNSDDLRKFARAVGPPPAPVEPLLAPADEAQQIADRKRTDPVTAARRRRVLALIRRPAPPEGPDAELLTLLAVARALPMERPNDRLDARQRLVDIARLTDPPDEVRKLLRKMGVGPGDEQTFAEALLPPGRNISEFYESEAGFPPGPH